MSKHVIKYEGEDYIHKISLDGDWDFTYTPNHIFEGEKFQIPKVNEFTVKMPVPGYWDDNVERMQSSEFWETAKFNPNYRRIDYPMGASMPPDASLPYLLGVGWYRKTIYIPTDWQEREITLYVGGVVLEAWVWLNGELIKYHLGHSTPFEVSLGENLRYGEVNEIIIAVANTRTDRLGCVIRGFKGFSAGIYRTVYIKVTGKARIKDCYIYPSYLRSDYIYSGSDNENK
ncbi:MAG: hypothetical protein GX754_07845 [Clostridiaceae bacterium]|nr:hypothetical protein [Clostridiaceae bacterium]